MRSFFSEGFMTEKIYDLDSNPSKEKNWWELDNMKRYFDLFKKYSNYFEVNTPNE